MYTLFVILIVIAAVLMIGIVLIQESKGGGLSSSCYGRYQRCLRMGCSYSYNRQLCDGEH